MVIPRHEIDIEQAFFQVLYNANNNQENDTNDNQGNRDENQNNDDFVQGNSNTEYLACMAAAVTSDTGEPSSTSKALSSHKK